MANKISNNKIWSSERPLTEGEGEKEGAQAFGAGAKKNKQSKVER